MRVRKRPNRAKASAASKPLNVAINAESAAAARLVFVALNICSSERSAKYHLVEKPPQTATSREALKLMTTRMAIGPYKKQEIRARA